LTRKVPARSDMWHIWRIGRPEVVKGGSMRRIHYAVIGVAALTLTFIGPAIPSQATHGGDVLVTNGSPTGPFSQNKQNEPAVAIDANHTNILAAGSNDNIDMETCNAGDPTTCPFTDGIGGSGIYFSFDSGDTWVQPTYQGLTARGCTGPDPCEPEVGDIGTLPNYYENGLVSDGDPALAFGPAYKNGHFSWDNGSRLYYANLTSNQPGHQTFKGAEAIAVSYTDDVEAAASGDNSAWSAPVVASKQNSALFSDKEQIWADNAESSPFFGNAYVCYGGFGGAFGHGSTPQPLYVLTSTNGGQSWTQHQVTPATNNVHSPNGFGRTGCTVRTASDGTVYVFAVQEAAGTPGRGSILMIKSHDGGSTFSRPVPIKTAYDTCNYIEDSIGRCVEDGVGGARDDLGSAPSVDISNGAPSGDDATDQIVLTWVDGRDGNNNEHVYFSSSTNGGSDWTPNVDVRRTGDRGYYSAPAISPNGSDVWLVYNAFTTPFRNNTTDTRALVGVVLHADVADGVISGWTEIHRGEEGDPRSSSQNNLAAEFLGDYVYAAATRDYGAAVWNDARNGEVCSAINEYRQDLHDEATASGQQTADPEEPRGLEDFERRNGQTAEPDNPAEAPPVQTDCPDGFGNSDIYGGTYLNP